MLLRLKCVHFNRQLGRRHDFRQKQKPPTLDLRAIAEIEVFGERIVLPASRSLDTSPPPDARRAIKVEEPPRAGARRLLDEEVTVQQHRLDFRQQRVLLVEVTPTRLDHADVGV